MKIEIDIPDPSDLLELFEKEEGAFETCQQVENWLCNASDKTIRLMHKKLMKFIEDNNINLNAK
jgi:hypothetical protein